MPAETLIDAGKLDKRVTLRSRLTTQDSTGGQVFTFSDFVTVWAAIEPSRAYQRFGGAQVQEGHDTLIKIRYIVGVRSSMVVRYQTFEGDDKYYEVIGVRLDNENRKGWMYLQCNERQGDGWWK